MANSKNINKLETPAAEELLKKIQDLEEGHAHLKQEMSKLLISGDLIKSDRQRSNTISSGRPRRRTSGNAASSFRQTSPLRKETRSLDVSCRNQNNTNISGGEYSGVKLTETQSKNILQAMGQSVHMMGLNGLIIYWNRMAQNLYGYTVSEVLGRTVSEVIIESDYAGLANLIIQRAAVGESWSGEFPVRNKKWERFIVITTVSPCRDESGIINSVICISSEARQYQEIRPGLSVSAPRRIALAKLGLDPEQPLQTAIASKISSLASKVSDKVKSKIKTGEHVIDDEKDPYSNIVPSDHKEDTLSSGSNTPRGDVAQSPFCLFSSTGEKITQKPTTDSSGDTENKPGIHKVLSSKAGAWMGKKGISWPWKGNDRDGESSDSRTGPFGWPWSHNDEHMPGQHASTNPESQSQPTLPKVESQPALTKIQRHPFENVSVGNTNEASGSWSSFNSPSSSESANSHAVSKVDVDTDDSDYEISWDDLTVGDQIGQGSCGAVYHAVWYGSDVAIKVFSKQEYPDDVILSFRQEVSLMKRLRHPNILLFMGAVTSPHHLCIVTEFLPRGSLFRLLQRNTTKFDWRRRVHMAMDIARGMNYLHHCHLPIIHRDLKSSNLLVDKNWTVKVGDFGLSRIKHETYLTTKTGKGTPQWMSPEVLRNEQADEKSDVYSYGVVLWEITTEKIPWDSLNAMQVIGAVGFMNQRLEIPKDVDPQWASLIESCWSSEPQSRPTFQEILCKLKDLQKKFTLQYQASRRDK